MRDLKTLTEIDMMDHDTLICLIRHKQNRAKPPHANGATSR